MYRTALPAKGLPDMDRMFFGMTTAWAAMPEKASLSISVRAAGRKKSGAGASRSKPQGLTVLAA